MAPLQPRFATKPPVKPMGTRSKGIGRQTSDKGPKSQNVKSAANNDVAQSSVKLTADVKNCLKLIASDFDSHKKLLCQLKGFAVKENVTRREIVTIGDTVAAYTELNDIEVRVAREFKRLCEVANVTEAEAEASSALIKPSTIDNMLEESAKILTIVMSKFNAMKDSFPDSPQIITYLDFVNPSSPHDGAQSEVGSSKGLIQNSGASSGTCRNIEGLRTKIARNKADYERKLTDFEMAYENSKSSNDMFTFQSLQRQLEKLESKSSIAFDKLTDKLETYSDVDESELVEFEDWVLSFSVKLESLIEEINKAIDKLKESSSGKNLTLAHFSKSKTPLSSKVIVLST